VSISSNFLYGKSRGTRQILKADVLIDCTLHDNYDKLEIWGKAQRESAWCPKFDWGENSGGGEIPTVAKSRSSNSNALANAERPTST